MDADLIKRVAQGLNRIKTYGPLRVAQGETLKVVYTLLAKRPPANLARELNNRRTAIETSLRSSNTRKADETVTPPELERQRQEITNVYVTASGIEGYQAALSNVSLLEAVGHSVANAPKLIGESVGAVAAGVGNTAGSLVGGLLGGLGPVLVLIIVAVVVVTRKMK